LISPEGITDVVTVVGSVLAIFLALDKIVGRLRRRPVLIDGKQWGNRYDAYLIFNESIPLTSFTLDVFAGENLLKKAFDELGKQRLNVRARDQITVTIDLEDPVSGSIDVELFYGERGIPLGSRPVTTAVLDSAMSYEYLNREVQINIGYLFKGRLGKLWHKVSYVGRKMMTS